MSEDTEGFNSGHMAYFCHIESHLLWIGQQAGICLPCTGVTIQDAATRPTYFWAHNKTT